MESKLCVKNLSGATITAITYLPPKREVIVGHEDGVMRSWELDTGQSVTTYHRHKGWVSELFYWTEGKVLFSASVDSTVIQWTSSFEPFYTIELPGPIYSLTWNYRKNQLMYGRKDCVGLLSLSGRMANNGLPLLSNKEYKVEGHSDIVKCVAYMGNKAYSAGFDRKLVVYEVLTLLGSPPLRTITVNHHAHDAGITCILITRDDDSSSWLATGSFDQKVKIWTAEGKLMLQISLQYVVTGLCYVFATKVLWVAAGTPMPLFYDAKLGVNVTLYVPVLGEGPVDKKRSMQFMKYFPEISEVIGYTNRKEVLSWKYSTHCCTCIQNSPSSAHIETITYTNKSPILIFTASYDGIMTKWERHQFNTFLYSSETLQYNEQLAIHLCSEDGGWNILEVVDGEGVWHEGKDRPDLIEKEKVRCRKELMKENYRGFVRSLFVESLNYLIASALDGKIFVWGYDEADVEMIDRMQKNTGKFNNVTETLVTGRVVGQSCLHVFNGHSSSVSGLAVVEKDSHVYLVSAGWDCVLCVWEISKEINMLSRVKHSPKVLSDDAIITDLEYSQEHDMLAYSTSDCVVHLCPFTKDRTGLKVTSSLTGHSEEVTQVRWNKIQNKWVTGSEDGTVRIWGAKGGSSCEMIVSVGGPVSVVTIDNTHGYIIIAVSNLIKVYDGELGVLQVSSGHTDAIQSILHIPELDQYVSAGWDKTLRFWKGYHPRHMKRITFNTTNPTH